MCLFVSYDEETAKDNLFDVALELQSNKRILADFGQLYFWERNTKTSKKTGIWNFLTTNWVRVQSSSVKKTLRWKVFAWWRPDFILVDDFENNDTKNSAAKTRRVIDYFDEMFPWLWPAGNVIFCCNKISDVWSVAYLYDKFENDSDARVYEIAVIEKWEVAWKDRYTMTDKEAEIENAKREDPNTWVSSLETIKRQSNKDWRKVFEQEYLNQPLVAGDRFFDINMVDAKISSLKWYSYDRDGKWKIWNYYDRTCDYIFGVDVSEWLWQDSSVIIVLNRTTMEIVAEYEYSYADPKTLTEEIKTAHKNYWWQWLIIVERNSIWHTVIELLKEAKMSRYMPLEQVRNEVDKVTLNKYGFNSNRVTKPKILFNLKDIFENWLIEIYSLSLLREMRWFSVLDIRYKPFDPNDDLSRHFDRVMALAIAVEWLHYKPKKLWWFKKIDPTAFKYTNVDSNLFVKQG